MEIGDSITLIFNNFPHKKEGTFLSKIIDRDENFLYVNDPRNIEPNKPLTNLIDEQITVNYVQNGVPFKFNTSVIKHVNSTVPALVITIPDKDEIKKIQRREFVRIQTDVDVAMHFPDSATPPIVSVTYDISGGGASIIMPPKTEISTKQMVTLYFVLHSTSVKYEYIKVDAEIIRFHTLDKV